MRKPTIPAAAAALALGLGLTACGSGSGSGGGGSDGALVVGATAVPAGEVLA
ncbi:hypothetical protein [Streptomyces sp. NPDC020747]|uniref:hypothetical protein n=1 Tax=Streptomyces sp. NPDC020747 TaxID=3365086 RepID=UPI0037902960